MVQVLVAAATYFVLAYVRTGFLFQVLTFLALVLCQVFIPFALVFGEDYWLVQIVDDYFRAHMYSIFSGREDVWPELLSTIQQRPITGYGTTEPWRFYRLEYGIERELSAHNLWLAILFQSGAVGLMGLIAFLWTVWRHLLEHNDNMVVRASIAFFVGTVFHESFEVSLTQNTLQIGLGTWAAIMLGVSFSWWVRESV